MTSIIEKMLISNKENISIKKDMDTVEILINDIKSTDIIDPGKEVEFANKRKRDFYASFLSTQFENLIILTGAGTSVGFGGKTMKELWDLTETELTSKGLETLCKAIGFTPKETAWTDLKSEQKDLEKLLSRANIAKEFVTTYDETPIDIPSVVSEIEKLIHKECNFELGETPHEQFLNKIVNRKLKDPRVKIFTLNYDTLFEQAAVRGNFTVIDGFSFSSPRTLSGRNFDYDIIYREKTRIKEEESFIPKVFHLYKPHGSVNWELNGESIIINDKTAKPLMIYPKDSKYENSYEQPFFEMMSRFQKHLRNDNVLLICIGFSLNDKHIVTAIKEAVTQNPSFRLLIVNRSIKESVQTDWFIKKAQEQYNITIVAEQFADFVEHYPFSKIYTDLKNTKQNPNDPSAV